MVVHEEVHKFVINFLITGTMSIISKTILAPLDRSKLIIQNQDSSLQILKGERKPYSGIFDIMRRVPKEQGIFSFWRGNGTNLMRSFPTHAFGFAFFDLYQYIFFIITKDENVKNKQSVKFLSGGLAGATTTFITYPLEFCQTRLATDFGSNATSKTSHVNREFSGLKDCLTSVYRIEGFKGCYKGVGIQIQGIFIYRSGYFGLYDFTKITYLKRNPTKEKIPMLVRIGLAQSCTTLASFGAYPFDTVGRRLMLDSARPPEYKLYRNTREVFKHLYNKNGIRAFYKGQVLNIFRSMGAAFILVCYDEILFLTEWKKKLKPS